MNVFSSVFGEEKDNYAAFPIAERMQKDTRIAILTGKGTEDLEFFYPYYRFMEEGYSVDVITEDGEDFEGKHGIGLSASKSVFDVNAQDYALLYLPGGKAPAHIRKNEAALQFVRDFAATGRTIASICHGAQILASAGLLHGKHVAAWPEIKAEIEQAGGIFIDEPLALDGQFVTARKPGDLPQHMSGTLQALKSREAKRRGKMAA